MAYDIEVLPAGARALKKLEPRVAARLSGAIDALADEPRPHGVKKLEGAKDLYRVRVGQYRIIYQIHDDKLVIVVVTLGHRRDVYR
jgi:mRNA interferase RelE/StbE